MERLRQYDYTILVAALALVGIGIVMIYSASSILAQERFGDPFYYLKRQSLFALLGLLCMGLAINVPHRWYRPLVYPLLLVVAISLILVLISPLGHETGGAHRWIRLGQMTIQPSEAAKLVLVLYLAYSLARKRERGTVYGLATGLLPHLTVCGCLMVLVLWEPDLGASLIMGALAFLMMFMGGVRLRHLLLTIALASPALYQQLLPYQKDRIGIYLQYITRPWEAPLKEAYHIKQSLYALANGGLLGVGIGLGRQKLFFLPEPHTDFIIAVIGEEWGFLGILVVCFLFLVLLVSGVRIAMAIPDSFGALLAMGIVSMIGLQAISNIAMAMGLLPTKGMVLPFLSYGGSSLLVNMTAVGILIHLSGQAQRERKV